MWQIATVPDLWDYNLHYHDFIWALPAEDAWSVVLDWIRRYPNERGHAGWDPYPISLRIQNWCMYFFGSLPDARPSDSPREADLWRSMFAQLSWLEKHIEWRLLGNHILENAAALAMAGATFGGSNGERWLREGLKLLAQQLPEIVLPDGGHVERSPMYHARLCQILDNLVRTGNAEIAAVVTPYLDKVRRALSHLSHPDGEIALFNDAAFGIYPSITELGIGQSKVGPFALPSSGYYGVRSPEDHYVLCDAGAIGPDYQPGHAHGDLLSFEMSCEGLRFVVDTGVYTYENDNWRAYCRSTRAHNTVEVNRLDQCDFWSAFRVGRRARPRSIKHDMASTGFSLDAEHTGYIHLRGSPIHRRSFRWHAGGILLVKDQIRSGRDIWMRSHIHLHPDVEIATVSEREIRLKRKNAGCTIVFEGEGRLFVETSWYFPEFGRRVENKVLVLAAKGSDVRSGFCIAAGSESVRFDLGRGATVDGTDYGW